jgi:hypothetical protein
MTKIAAKKQTGGDVALWQIDQLRPYEHNTKTHPATQIARIAASIIEFGFVGAVVVRGDTIAKGHGTLEAVRQIYDAGELLYPAPGKKAGAKPYPKGQVPVLAVDGWTDEQIRAYQIVDNKLPEESTWNLEALTHEFKALDLADFDLSLTGFDADEIKALIDSTPKITEQSEKLRPKKFMRVLVSVPVDAAIDAKPFLDSLKNVAGVEIDYGAN